MDRERCLEWFRRHHGAAAASPAARLAEGVLERLSRLGGAARPSADHFQACLNDRDRFGIAKLVHVIEGPAALSAARRRAVREAVELANSRCGARFSIAPLERFYDELERAGVRDWLPIVSLELRPGDGAAVEFSLYCERQPAAAAKAAAEALGVRDRPRVAAAAKALEAVGLDLLADGGARLKLYARAPADRAPALLELLDAALRPPSILLMTRTSPDGEFEARDKAYVPLPSRSSGRPAACLGE